MSRSEVAVAIAKRIGRQRKAGGELRMSHETDSCAFDTGTALRIHDRYPKRLVGAASR